VSAASATPQAPEDRTLSARTGWTERLPTIALAVVLAVAAVVLMHAGRETTFYFDDWDWVQERGDWRPYTFLRPHNEHLSAVPILVYKVLFETVGLAHYAVYRAVLVAVNLLAGALLYAYARPRVGAWPGVALAACLVLMGPSYWDVLWAFQIGFVISLAAGLAALLALERRTRRGDLVATAALLVSLGSSSMGLPILAGAIVEIVWRRDRARWWVVGVPLLLYAAWYARYGESSTKLSNLPAVPGWIRDAADDAAGAITGLGPGYGAILVVGLVALVARELLAERIPRARLLAVVAIPLALWTATALARAGTPVTPHEARYLYPGGLFLALVALEAGRGRVPRGRAAALLAVGLAAGAVMNAKTLADNAVQLRGLAETTIGSLSAAELVGPSLPPDMVLAENNPQIRARLYFAAVERYGSTPALAPAELERASAGTRAAADQRLWSFLGATLAPAADARPAAAPPRLAAATAGTATPAGGCLRFAPSAAEAELDVLLPAGGLLVRPGDAPVEARLRRFADAFPEDALASAAPGAPAVLRLPRDRAPQPWHVSLRSAAPFSACAAG
jgi:hypothetical protein